MTATLTFAQPMPGLAPHRDFTIDEIPGAPGLFSLAPVDDSELKLHVIAAEVYLPHYRPEIPADAAESLGAVSDPQFLVVTTLSDSGPQVNLLAPIALDPETGNALQVILDGDWPLRVDLADVAGAA